MPTVLRPEFFQQFAGPTVYIWRRGTQFLYVGCSKQTLARLTNHETVNSIEPFGPDDAVELHRCEDSASMHALERELIQEHEPKYNGDGLKHRPPRTTCLRCGKNMRSSNGARLYCSPKCRSVKGNNAH